MSQIHTSKLSEAQIGFLLSHHEAIERAYAAGLRGDQHELSELIAQMIHSEEYKHLFGQRGWDDVYDDYQDAPEYDYSLRKALREEFQHDVDADIVQLPEGEADYQVRVNVDDFLKGLALDAE